MSSDSTAPATKADVTLILDHIKRVDDRVDRLEKRVDGIEAHILTIPTAVEFEEKHKETRHHFDVIVENIVYDLRSANREEIEVVKDTKRDHEERLITVERHIGFRP